MYVLQHDGDRPGPGLLSPEEVKEADNLTELVTNLNTITEQDSLLEICDLPEDERNNRIAEIIAQLEEEEEARKRAAEAAAEAELANAGDQGAGMWCYIHDCGRLVLFCFRFVKWFICLCMFVGERWGKLVS